MTTPFGQNVFATGGSVQQALGSIYNTTTIDQRPADDVSRLLVSVEPPLGRLDCAVRGRDDLVGELCEVVRVDAGALVVLSGGGGYGKTTVALRVIAEFDGEIPVWWVDATTEASLLAGTATVAVRLGLDPVTVHAAWSGRGGSPLELLWQRLDTLSGPWVLVFDNADDQDVLAAAGQRLRDGTGWCRCPHGTGTVLVTSRTARDWPARARVLPVPHLGIGDAAQVLLDLVDQEPDGAYELAVRLGGLPLALRLAGTYLQETRAAMALPGLNLPTTFAEYLESLDDRFVELTDAWSSAERRHRELLGRTWELSLDLLQDRGQSMARPCLRLLACLAVAPIPIEVLNAEVLAASTLFAGIVPVQLWRLLTDLDKVGLIELADKTVILHPVVRDTNLHQQDLIEHRTEYLDRCLALLDIATRDVDLADPQGWPRVLALVPHCREIATLVGDPPDASQLGLAAAVVHRAAEVCGLGGLPQQASELYQLALGFRRAVLGDDHADTLTTRHGLAKTVHILGRLADAEAEYRALLAARQVVLGFGHADTLSTRHNLAVVWYEQYRLREAHTAFANLLTTLKHGLGAEHPTTLTIRHNLALVTHDLGDPAAAEAELRLLLRIRYRALGPDHPDTLTTRHNLARALHTLGHTAAADAEYQRALDGRRRVLGERHPATLATRQSLAVVADHRRSAATAQADRITELTPRHRVLGGGGFVRFSRLTATTLIQSSRLSLMDALVEFNDILTAQTTVLGENHPDTLTTRHSYATLLHRQRNFAAAETEYRHVLANRRRVLGPDHPDTLETWENLIHTLARQDKPADAASEDADLFTMASKSTGHPTSRRRHSTLTAMLDDVSSQAETTEHREVIEQQTKVLGADHPDTLTSRYYLALNQHQRGDLADAEEELRRVLAGRARRLGKEHPDTVAARHQLAHVQFDREQFTAARAEYDAVLTIRTASLGAYHPSTLATRHYHATTLRKLGDLPAAANEYREILVVRQWTLGMQHPMTLLTRYDLATTLYGLNDQQATSLPQLHLRLRRVIP